MSVQMPAPHGAPAVVLDTNVALDWLVFRDARVQPVVDALEGGRLRAIACARMRGELWHMLGHRSLARWASHPVVALGHFDRLVRLLEDPLPTPQRAGLHCTDTDDQVFLDLALAHGARWLFTQDRALLKLARRAATLDLAIVPPQHWTPVPD